jgi:cardiolipin synthase A/B
VNQFCLTPGIQDKSLSIRFLAEQAFSRTTGASLTCGNRVSLLKDAAENYPAWLEALRSARQTIHFESYSIHEDDIGWQFGEVLANKAREGVKVRILYDWMGALGTTSRRFWRKLKEAGAEVRCFNPPRLDSPLHWVSRDHRKMIGVDGKVAFVTGLCVGRMWVGYPDRNIPPWRDTGIEVHGPAVADIERSFRNIWALTGAPLPTDEVFEGDAIPAVGDAALRVIPTIPNTAGLYRLDQLIAAMARRSLWMTDAYFVAAASYVQALRAAVKDGVDVRLLVPGSTDILILRELSRSGYQPLLEGGVRVFEWNGPMIHAKTAVADGRWARVGSTNLNISSWFGNYELDVAVEDEKFAQEMEEMYLEDLKHATEVVLSKRRRVSLAANRQRRPLREKKIGGGSVSRAGASAVRLSNIVGAAITNHRLLGPAEARITGIGGLLLLLFALTSVLLPRAVTIPIALLSGWLGLSLLIRTHRLFQKKRKEEDGPDSK